MRRTPCIAALCLLLAMGMTLSAFALTPTGDFYVNDYVGILSDSQIDDLVSRSNTLDSQNGAQVVTVIVDYYVGSDIRLYANDLFNDWGIGSEGDNNGVLLLVAVEDGDVTIEVGDGLMAYIPDSKAGSILDDVFMPSALDDDLAGAIYNTHVRLLSEAARIDTAPPASSQAPVVPPAGGNAGNTGGNSAANTANAWVGILWTLLFLIAIVAVVTAIARAMRPKRYPPAGPTVPGQPYNPYYRPRRRFIFFPVYRRPRTPPPPRPMTPPPPRNPTARPPSGPSSRPPGSSGGFFGGSGGSSSGGGSSRSTGSSRSFGSGGGRTSGGGRSSGGGGRSSGGGSSRSFRK